MEIQFQNETHMKWAVEYRQFLESGEIPMDNKAAEREICDTVNGIVDSAIVYSITEIAKANYLKPYEYLKLLLTEIPKHMDDMGFHFPEELMPWFETLPAECREKMNKLYAQTPHNGALIIYSTDYLPFTNIQA